ncbi:MAG: hypothetical protein E7395_01630 [Ruminococcaceae bacterium]|nr:hypothetical protein [Oscillospiraceae bacterium]
MKAITNARVVTVDGIIWDGVILLENGRIEAVGKKDNVSIPLGAEIIDADGAYVGPGFVDIHVHGGDKYHTAENPIEAAAHFLKHGETTILATPSYNYNFQDFLKAIKTVKENMSKAPNIRGMYMEGPYTNCNYGSHSDVNPWRHPIDPTEYKALVDEAGEFATVWTVAPEREGILDFMKYARKVNPKVKFALGHSEATIEQIRALGSYIPTLMTHVTNATGPNKWSGVRQCGPDEYALSSSDIYCEMICDSCAIHVAPFMQRFVLKNKGLDKTVLITDSTSLENPSPEKYAHINDLNFDHNGGLSGSKLTMDMACRNIMTHTNCGIAQAFLMASANPSKAIGMYDEIGSIEAGKRADFVFVDDMFNVKKVILGGELV